MHECEMKYTGEEKNLPSEKSHPVTYPLGENNRNHVKKQEKSLLEPNQIQ